MFREYSVKCGALCVILDSWLIAACLFRWCLHEKTRTGASFIPGRLFDFVSRYLKVHFMLVKYTSDSKSETLRMRYPFQSTG